MNLLRETPFFDVSYYRDRYMDPDDLDDPYNNYLSSGQIRFTSPYFDPIEYLDAYPDVAEHNVDPLIHFLQHGIFEGRWRGLVNTDITELYSVPPYSLSAAEIKNHMKRIPKEDIALLENSDLFDQEWYRKEYALEPDIEPVEHYLVIGHLFNFDPGPNFSTIGYKTIHSDVGVLCPLLHYVKWGADECRPLPLSRNLYKVAHAGVKDLSEIEPSLMVDYKFHEGLNKLPVVSSVPNTSRDRNWIRIAEQIDSKMRYFVFVPWMTLGGADLVAVNIVKALQRKHGIDAVALVLADYDKLTAQDWLPAGTKIIHFIGDEPVPLNYRQEYVERMIWMVRPEQIFNVNSLACWEALTHTGKALSTMTSLRATLFCRDFSPDGRAVGYSDSHIREGLPHLDVVYFDTKVFIEDIREQYGLGSEFDHKLRFLPTPCDTHAVPVRPAETTDESVNKRLRVIWSGRFCMQKNIDLLKKIIQKGTDFDFEIWGLGSPEFEKPLREFADGLPNCEIKGPHLSLSELEFEKGGAFLFTSHFEGMPTIILRVAAAQFPIVATRVGGVGELIDDSTGWPVDDRYDPDPYIEALYAIASQPDLVKKKLAALAGRIDQERTPEVFERELFR